MDLLTILAVILVVAWVFGFGFFHVAGGLIHLLLVFAVIAVVVRLVTGRRI
ncbi:MAG TPA: lmo0937 family membrane protein [Polyangiales bacterium]